MALRAQRFTTFDRLKLMLILSALIAQCTVLERAGTAAPVSIKRSEHLSVELLGLDLNRSVSAVDVPVLFFLGRYDQHANANLAAAYFENLRAPVKRVQWFEKSAHNIPFEEPRLFNATVVRELQSVGIGTGHSGGWVAYRGPRRSGEQWKCWANRSMKRM